VAQKTNLSFKNKFLYICVIDEDSGFKFGKQLGFAKSDPTNKKVGVALGSGSTQKLEGSPLIFWQRLKLATSNLVHSLGLPRPS